METKKERKYLGKGVSHSPSFVNFSVCLSDIEESDTFEFKGKKYIKLTVAKMKEPDQYNKTHTVYVDDFTPKEVEQKEAVERERGESDLPF